MKNKILIIVIFVMGIGFIGTGYFIEMSKDNITSKSSVNTKTTEEYSIEKVNKAADKAADAYRNNNKKIYEEHCYDNRCFTINDLISDKTTTIEINVKNTGVATTTYDIKFYFIVDNAIEEVVVSVPTLQVEQTTMVIVQQELGFDIKNATDYTISK